MYGWKLCALLWCGVNTYLARCGSCGRGLGPSETEIFRSEDWNLVHQTLSANRGGTMFDVCERLVTAPSRYCSRRHEKLSNIV